MEFHVGGTFKIVAYDKELATIISVTEHRVYYKYATGGTNDWFIETMKNMFSSGKFIDYNPLGSQYDFQVGDTFFSNGSDCTCTISSITQNSLRINREGKSQFVRDIATTIDFFKRGTYHSYVSIKSNQSNANGTKNENQDKTRTSDTIGRAEKCGSAIASSIRGQIESGERYSGNKIQGKTVASRITHVEISSCAISS